MRSVQARLLEPGGNPWFSPVRHVYETLLFRWHTAGLRAGRAVGESPKRRMRNPENAETPSPSSYDQWLGVSMQETPFASTLEIHASIPALAGVTYELPPLRDTPDLRNRWTLLVHGAANDSLTRLQMLPPTLHFSQITPDPADKESNAPNSHASGVGWPSEDTNSESDSANSMASPETYVLIYPLLSECSCRSYKYVMCSMMEYEITVVYTGFRGWGGSRQQWVGVLFYIGEIKNFAFFQTRKFSKNVKKSMKIL